ncbi:Holliday junction resolvase [Candidatus Pacearchaeota archaeon CG06_land_8_20_14_3_00_35_12]|nr:MAG: Holliday junction resolvase [Candidatus Pacearchaeota archaeon CG06_land_8_20_14_3_00_35_12]
MGNKEKGSAAERELLHMLWREGFACVRVAGSGSTTELSCDLIAGKKTRKYAIECKTCKESKRYLNSEQIQELLKFSEILGLSPIVAVKFNHKGWWFIEPEKLENTGKGLAISAEDISEKGISFENFVLK